MKQLILTDTAKCEGCNRCIRVCPVNEANIAFMEDGKIKVRVDKEKCIACGACIEVCQHEARDYDDDTERFFNDLRNGVKISLLVAPSVRTNFANWQPLLAWLKASGVGKIIDVSLGADICTWAHIRYIEQNNPASVITQPCPAIVNYITKYETKLLPVLSPVHSPMLCTAVFMKQYLRISDNIAALSPCVAKTHEFEETGLVKYNVTFKKLAEYLAKNRVQIPDASFRFDNVDSSLGRIYSMPGGLKENVEYYLGKSVRIDKAEGQSTVYRHLDELAQEWPANWPPLFDVLNCPEGCNAGTGCLRDKSLFSINKIMDEERQTAVHKYQKTDRAKFTELFKLFDKNLALNDFIRTYVAHSVCPITYDERDVENAFLSLGKTTQEQRKHNCYACGSETCHDMAVRIAKGINVAENCMEKTRSDILQEHKAFIKEKDKSCENLSLILSEVEVIRKRFENVLSDVANIENVLEQYDEMAKLIREMALQTKILSLNASVEAVRAGAAGKGFAVVAQAIRDLATQSQTSVDTVSDTGLSAQKAIGAITQASDKVNTSILKVVNNIEEISQAMNGLNSYDQVENF